jgi:hypothetical protein
MPKANREEGGSNLRAMPATTKPATAITVVRTTPEPHCSIAAPEASCSVRCGASVDDARLARRPLVVSACA